MGKTAIEIERKFLLKYMPSTKWDMVLDIIQFYGDGWRIRRSIDESTGKAEYFLNKKKRIGPGTHEEFEKKITRKTFNEMVAEAMLVITKRRHIKNAGKLKWEVDWMYDCRFAVAEIEVPDFSHKVRIPKFIQEAIISEMTTVEAFTNRKMASKYTHKQNISY